MMTLVFFRKDGFYLLDMPSISGKTVHEIARDNALCNPDTIRVETVHGHILWRA